MYFKPKRNWAQEFDEREDAREEARQERLRKEREERESIKPDQNDSEKNGNNENRNSAEVQKGGNLALKQTTAPVFSLTERKSIEREVAVAMAESSLKTSQDVYRLYEGPNGQLTLFAPIIVERPKTRRTSSKKVEYPSRRVSDLYYDLRESEC